MDKKGYCIFIHFCPPGIFFSFVKGLIYLFSLQFKGKQMNKRNKKQITFLLFVDHARKLVDTGTTTYIHIACKRNRELLKTREIGFDILLRTAHGKNF